MSEIEALAANTKKLTDELPHSNCNTIANSILDINASNLKQLFSAAM